MPEDAKKKERRKVREVGAIVTGLVLIVSSLAFIFLGIIQNEWIMFILVALGLGLVFPKKLADAAKAIANLSPLKSRR